MLKAQSLVVLGKHVRSLLVHEDRVVRCSSANTNDGPLVTTDDLEDDGIYVPQDTPAMNALSSGHGSGF